MSEVRTDDELVQLDLPELLRKGLADAAGGPHRRVLFGEGAVGGAVRLDRLGVLPGSLTFLAEVARAGGASYAAGLAEPLPDPGAADIATAWLQAAAAVSDDGTVVATWLDAVAVLIEARRRNRDQKN